MYLFGSGTLIAKPFGPNAAGSPTPIQLGVMQECQVEISASQKELYGKSQYPVAIARTAAKVNCKAKFAKIYGKALNDLFFGNTVTTGQTIGVIDEAHAAGATVTITPPASGTFAEDFGVRDATTGNQMTLTTGSPAAGVSYSISGAVYTFHASQGAMLISYSYTVTTGVHSLVTNKPMGSMPVFEANLVNNQYQSPNNSVNFKLKLINCISAKLTLPFKNEDFSVSEFDFSAFADGADNVFQLDIDE